MLTASRHRPDNLSKKGKKRGELQPFCPLLTTLGSQLQPLLFPSIVLQWLLLLLSTGAPAATDVVDVTLNLVLIFSIFFYFCHCAVGDTNSNRRN